VTGPALPPDVIIVTGPSSDSLVVGGEGAITVTVQAVANELPEIPVTFTSTGGVTFNNGNVSPDGASTTILTATRWSGSGIDNDHSGRTSTVRVSVPGTTLNSNVTFSTPIATPTRESDSNTESNADTESNSNANTGADARPTANSTINRRVKGEDKESRQAAGCSQHVAL